MTSEDGAPADTLPETDLPPLVDAEARAEEPTEPVDVRAAVDAPAEVVPVPIAPAPPAFAAAPPIDPAYALAAPSTPQAKGLAIAALIVGIAAFVLGWMPLIGLVLGAVAIGLGIAALRRRQSKGMGITGLVLGALGVISSILASVLLAVIITQPAFQDAFQQGFEEGMAAEESVEPIGEPAEEAVVEEEAAATPADERFPVLDDAAFAAIVADPSAAYGQTYTIYGEVQQFDENTGPCSAVAAVDNTQQSNWEGYAVTAWLAGSNQTTCPEFEGVEAFSHVAVSATVLAVTPTEFEDGTVEDILTFGIISYEELPALP